MAMAERDYAKVLDSIMSIQGSIEDMPDRAFRFLNDSIETQEGFEAWEEQITKRLIPYAKGKGASDLALAKLYYQLNIVQHVQGEERFPDNQKSLAVAESLARKSGNSYWLGRILDDQGTFEINHGDPVKGLELEEEAIKTYQGAGEDSEKRIAGCLYSEAVVFFNSGDWEGLKGIIERMKKHIATLSSQYRPIALYNLYAVQTVYFSHFFNTSENPREKQAFLDSMDKVGQSAIYLIDNTPEIWANPQALPIWDYYNRAVRFVEDVDTPVVDSAEYYLRKMTEIDFRGLEDMQMEAEVSAASLRAEMWMKLGYYDKARQSILSTIEKVDSLKGVNNVIIDKITLFKNLVEISEQTGHYKEALRYAEQVSDLEKERYSDERAKAIKDIEIKYKTQETQLELARSEARRSSTLMWLFAASALTIVIIATFIIYANRQRRRRMQREMEFASLRTDTERQLTRQYIEGLETERERMSRELHDGVCNDLLAIQMNLRANPDALATERLIESCRESVRRISHELNPPEFAYATIDEVVRYYLEKQKDSGKTILYHSESDGREWDNVPDSVSLEVYRIIQEAVGNAIRHSGGECVTVEMDLTGDVLKVIITDNGRFNPTGRRGVGLKSMRQRAHAINGIIKIAEAQNKGTIVSLEVKIQ